MGGATWRVEQTDGPSNSWGQLDWQITTRALLSPKESSSPEPQQVFMEDEHPWSKSNEKRFCRLLESWLNLVVSILCLVLSVSSEMKGLFVLRRLPPFKPMLQLAGTHPMPWFVMRAGEELLSTPLHKSQIVILLTLRLSIMFHQLLLIPTTEFHQGSVLPRVRSSAKQLPWLLEPSGVFQRSARQCHLGRSWLRGPRNRLPMRVLKKWECIRELWSPERLAHAMPWSIWNGI